jgi:uncharacterized protein
MSNRSIINRTKCHVRRVLQGEGSGHDWWHVERVRKTALRIGKEEGADLFIVELAALLHDIADWKAHDGNEEAGPREAEVWLSGLEVDRQVIDHVCGIVRDVSFKGAGVKTPMKTVEGMAVQDADRLDALGATGIARAFAYGGHKGREIYNPDIKPERHMTFDQYKKGEGPGINHFYEKLLLLQDRMNTETGKRLAAARHAFMEGYLKQFFTEWEGEL